MNRNEELPDYDRYHLSRREAIGAGIKCAIPVIAFGVFFYQSVFSLLILWPVGLFLWKKEGRRRTKQQRREFTRQFMECIQTVSVVLQSGFSVENAFLESEKDMESFFGKESLIFRELEAIRRGLAMHIPLEEQLVKLGQRTGIAEVIQFAEIFSIAKKRGGDMSSVISNTVNRIQEKVKVREEIQTLLAGKEMEQMIMKIMPFGIIGYIGLSYPGYFDVLYHNGFGILIMTVGVAIYVLAFFLGELILHQIEKEMTEVSYISKEKEIPIYKDGILGCISRLSTRLPEEWICSSKVRTHIEYLYPENKEQSLCDYKAQKVVFFVICSGCSCFLLSILFWKEWQDRISLLYYPLLLLAGIAFSFLLFLLLDKDLEDKAKKRMKVRKQQYPDIVHKLELYMRAGLSVRGCFQLMAQDYDCILFACRDLQAGMLETVTYERFGRRLGIQEYVRLGMLLGQNVKRGNRALLERLEEETRHLSRLAEQEAKALGEKAQTKLLIPMVLYLGVVMLVIMVPAFMI